MNQEKSLYPMRELNAEEQAERDELFRELGQAYYEGAYEDPLPQLLPIFDRLTELMKEPEPENVCPECGAPITDGAVFCEECGNRLIPEEPKPPQEMAPRFCPECGNRLGPGARFCGKCGTRVE